MGLFNSIFSNRKDVNVSSGWKTLTAYSPVFTSWDGQLYESELVRSAIDARARHISKLHVKVTGAAKPSLQAKLRTAPNTFQTWSQFLYRLSTILDMQNTAFIVPVLDEYNEITGYFPVLPSLCKIVEDKNGNPWVAYTFVNGQTAAIELERVGIMTKYQYKDDIFGSSNSALNETMKLIDMQNQGIKEAIKNSATYRFMASVNNFSKAEDLKKERQRFSEENFSSEANAGGLLLFPNTYTNVQQIKSTPFTVDAEQRQLIDKNVYNYFGVNEEVLQNKAFGDGWNAFYEGCVEVFAIQFSEVISKMTFTSREKAQGSNIIATSNRLQYMSNKDKLDVATQLLDRGIITINDAREIFNLGPVEGGDVRIIRGEYYNAEEKTQTEEDEEENG